MQLSRWNRVAYVRGATIHVLAAAGKSSKSAAVDVDNVVRYPQFLITKRRFRLLASIILPFSMPWKLIVTNSTLTRWELQTGL